MICIISDTHENQPAIVQAVQRMKDLSPELVVHCGDIISPPVLKLFEGLPMRLVYGNNDGERAGLARMADSLGFYEIADELDFTVRQKRFYTYHGTSTKRLRDAVSSGQFDYILTGHTHEMRDEQVGRTRIINPGALFAAPTYTFATLDLEQDNVQFVELTGP